MDPRYLKGIQLFNEGEYFEAHEIWEDVWGECVGTEKRFYQLLIQIAVALLKWQSGIPGGAEKMYGAAQKNFSQLPKEYLSINISMLNDKFNVLFEPLIAAQEKSSVPFPRRVFQLRLTPKA